MSPLAFYSMLVRLAWRNVIRNWRHSLATTAAIASGFTAVSLFDGFIAELDVRNADGFRARGMMGDVVIQKEGAQIHMDEDFWAYTLDKTDQAFIEDFLRNDPDFDIRVRFLHITGLITAGKSNAVFIGNGYDIEEGAKMRGARWEWNTLAGKPLIKAAQPSVILGTGLGQRLDCESTYQGPSPILPEGNYIAEERPYTCANPRMALSATTEAAQVNAFELPVAGIYDAGFREVDQRSINIPLAEAQRLVDTDKISMVTLRLKPNRPLAPFIKRLKDNAGAKGIKLEVVPWHEHKTATYVRGGLKILHGFRDMFMIIVVTIGVMSVANTMMKSVNERIREIGTLRSLGFLRSQLVAMFSLEGMFLSFIACVVGLLATFGLTFVISALDIKYRAGILAMPISLIIVPAPKAWLFSTVTLSLLATGTAWFSSRRASRMVVADAMRHV